jgi:2-oxoglutarate ferredoxin oxidoreductase subunit alpha
MKDSSVNILIGGEAGQGLVTLGSMLTKTLVREGYEVAVCQDYMSRIRGGHNTYAIRFGPETCDAPREDVDVLVALNQETIDLHKDELTENGVVVCGAEMDPGGLNAYQVPFKELTEKKIYWNTVALGVVAATICSAIDTAKNLLRQTFKKKGDEVIDANLEVLQKAWDWQKEQDVPFACPAPSEGHEGRLAINGNEAIALGALAAGVNFCSFYPMTPSTSVPLTLIAKGQEMGVVVEQVEDEIAAINMALGASFGGARAMTATSGGGFSLMCEGLSLCGITETPLVIVLAQRPGPATGLPTRTEQGDLNLALYGGHGEFPRAIYAPGDLPQCFRLAHKAFDTAEKFQVPAFVLTDQFLADSYRSTEPFDLDALPEVAAPLTSVDNPGEYKRYAVTDSGVSPRLVPGKTDAVMWVDSDEHDETGHIIEDAETRIAQMDKRMRKMEGMLDEVVPPDYDGPDNPDTLLVFFGSTKAAAGEAARILRDQGKSIATLHFSQVYPLQPEQFLDALETAGQTVCVEANHDGQFRNLLHQESGFITEHLLTRYDGRPFTAAYIIEHLEEIA